MFKCIIKTKKTSNIVKKFLTLSVKTVINQPPITKLNIHIDYIYLLIDKAKVFDKKKPIELEITAIYINTQQHIQSEYSTFAKVSSPI